MGLSKSGRIGGDSSRLVTLSHGSGPRPPVDKRSAQYKLKKFGTYNVDATMDVRDTAILTAENPIQPNRILLYGLYKKIDEDGHLTGEVKKLIEKTLGERFELIDTKKPIGKRFDTQSKFLLENQWFYDFCKHALESLFWGHSLIEFDPPKEGRFQSLGLVDRLHVRPEYGDILLEIGHTVGIPFRKGPLSKYLIEVGKWNDLGIYKKASKYVILKWYSLTDWSRRNERYGQPILIIRTESDDAAEIDKKAEMAENLSSNSWAILDDTDEIDLVESNQAFTWQTFDGHAKRMNENISKLINTVVVGEAGGEGSRAKEEVGERKIDAVIESSMRWLGFQVTGQLLPFLRKHGYPISDSLAFKFYKLTEEYEEARREQRMGGAAGKYPEGKKGEGGEKKKPTLRSLKKD
ncbi:MAG: hypothetical protein AAF587_29580 [Bacteroidota bacterium]